MKFTKKMMRRFGIEIEISGGDYDAMQIEIREYNESVSSNQRWVFKYEHCGREIVSPILKGKAGFTALKTICEIVTRHNGRVDSNCGLHVHLDITEWGNAGRTTLVENAKRFTKLYAKYEDGIDSIMPRSRKAMNNSFCYGFKRGYNGGEVSVEDVFKKIDELSTFDGMRSFQNWASQGAGRYNKVNWYAYNTHSTVEIRHHSATTDFNKLENWIQFLLGFVSVAEKRNKIAPKNRVMNSIESRDGILDHQIDRMMALSGADSKMKGYFTSRSASMRNR